MRFLTAFAAALFLAAPLVHAQQDSVERQVLAAERQGLDNLKTGDNAEFASLIADDAVFVDARGPASKNTVVNNTKEFRLQDYTIETPSFVRVSRDSRLLVYKLTESGTSHGHSFSATVYVSSLWAKRGGKWVCLFSQETAAH